MNLLLQSGLQLQCNTLHFKCFSDSTGVPGCGEQSHPQLVPVFNMLGAPNAALLARLRSSEPTQHVDALPAVCELTLNARYLFAKLKEAFG